MKTDSTRVFLWRFIVFILLLLYSLIVFAQPDYDFQNKSLVSGTDRQVGAKYRFNNVKTGVDAFVTILNLTGGVTLNDVDGGGGFKEALQPVIDVPANSKGYAEFRIDFLTAGTNNPMVQWEVPMTPIDVDGQNYGNGTIYEFDQIQIGSGYVGFDASGSELKLTYSPGMITGTNIAGIDYGGIDTSARRVMFTVVNGHVSSLFFRVGADNKSGATRQRLRSVYFKNFYFNNFVLPVSNLLSFNGVSNDNGVRLSWNLLPDNTISSIILEKAYTADSFQPLTEFGIEGKGQNEFNYTDNSNPGGAAFYRLKMITTDNQVKYSSTLYFRGTKKTGNAFNVYPSVVNSCLTAQVNSSRSQAASFEVFSYSGNKVFTQSLSLQQGENNVRISDLDRLPSGPYISVLRTAEGTYSYKITKL